MSSPILEARDVSFRYSRKGPMVLDGMDLVIEKGSKTAVLGANGAGKSTLFSVLNALVRPKEGIVLYDGEPIRYRHRNIVKMRSEVSILFQNPNDMMFKPYVEQDVAFGPENMKLPKDDVEARVEEALFTVGMSEYRKTPIMKLSYGQRKRVTLAGVLAMKPSVLIMDEPTAGLDPQMAYEVMEIAEQLHTSGVTVVMSSHDTGLTYSWADTVSIISGGRCVYSGDPEGFYSDCSAVYNAGLLPPSVFTLNESLSAIGRCSREPFPRTQTQMSVKLSEGRDGGFGTLHILPVERDSDVSELVFQAGLGGMPAGVYGISARIAMRKSQTKADFMYNGPECCMMKCLAGEDALLICDPLMVDSARRSADFIDRNGFGRIEVDLVR